MRKSQLAYLPLKRLIGIVGSIVGIIVCFVLLWWWVIPINMIVTKGHPFFLSERIGKNEKHFKLIKFRSMKLDANPQMTSHNPNVSESITKFGSFLRKSSIDETPQLFNILAGQMAFIGPRPLINIGEDTITIQKRIENGSIILRPGISGYAQVHKRGELDPEHKAYFDLIYLNRFSLWLDAKIFVYTILRVFGAVKGR